MSEWQRSKYEPYTRTPRFFGHFANGGMVGEQRRALGVDAVQRNRADRRASGQRGYRLLTSTSPRAAQVAGAAVRMAEYRRRPVRKQVA